MLGLNLFLLKLCIYFITICLNACKIRFKAIQYRKNNFIILYKSTLGNCIIHMNKFVPEQNITAIRCSLFSVCQWAVQILAFDHDFTDFGSDVIEDL